MDVKDFADMLIKNLEGTANAHEYHGYDGRLSEKEREQRHLLAWAFRSLASTVHQVLVDLESLKEPLTP